MALHLSNGCVETALSAVMCCQRRVATQPEPESSLPGWAGPHSLCRHRICGVLLSPPDVTSRLLATSAPSLGRCHKKKSQRTEVSRYSAIFSSLRRDFLHCSHTKPRAVCWSKQERVKEKVNSVLPNAEVQGQTRPWSFLTLGLYDSNFLRHLTCLVFFSTVGTTLVSVKS